MATKYCRSVGGNWSTNSTWSITSSAGTANTVAPTAADDVILDAGSATSAPLVIDGGNVCRSINCTGFINTLTHNAVTLSIGDATAGSGNVALKFVSGMTYGRQATSTISFISTSSTQQTIDFGTQSVSNLTVNGAGSNYALISATTSTATVTLTGGTLHTDGASDNSNFTHSWNIFTTSGTRTLNLGNSIIGLTSGGTAWNAGAAGYTLTPGTSTLNFTGTNLNLFWGNGTYYDGNFTGAGSCTFNNISSWHSFNRTGTAAKSDSLTLTTTFTVTGTLTLAGQSVVNRLAVISSVLGAQQTITYNGVTNPNTTLSNVNFRDMKAAGSFGAWSIASITGNSGDCGGNSSMTFTTPVAQTSTGTSSFTWSTHGWTTRVPLPQDDVTVSNTFSASQTVTVDMPSLGKNVTFSSNVVTLSCSISTSVFGSWVVNSNSGLSSWTGTLALEGRSSYTITNAGVPRDSITLAAPGGTYTLQDAISVTRAGGSTLSITNGTFNANNFNVSAGVISITGTSTRTVTMGSGTWSYNASSASGTPWNAAVVTGLTLNANSSTIKCVTNSASTKPFSGGGLTYNNIWFSDASTGANQIIGSNTFNNLKIDPGRTVNFTAGTTTTVASATISGTSGSLVTIGSITAAGHTLTKTGGGEMGFDWMSISRSTATPSSTWDAGSNSTDGGNNSGWNFGNITPAPSTIAVATAVIAPSIKIDVTVAPSTLAVATAVIAPTENISYTATPSTLAVATAVIAPTVITATSTTVTPSTLAVATAVIAPSIRCDVTITPATLAVATAVIAPSISGTANVTISTLQVTSAVIAPSVVADYTATPSTLTVATTVIAPTESGTANVSVGTLEVTSAVIAPSEKSDYTATPSTLEIASAVIAPSITGDANVTVSTIGVTSAVIAPIESIDYTFLATILTILTETIAPLITDDVTVTPSTLTVASAVIDPTVVIENAGNATVAPATFDVATSVIAPTLRIDCTFIASTLTVNSQVVAPIASISVTSLPSTISVASSVIAPTIVIDCSVTPSTLTVTSELIAPSLEIDATFLATLLSIASQVIAPSVQASTTLFPSTLEVHSIVIDPSVSTGSTVVIKIFTFLTFNPVINIEKIFSPNINIEKSFNPQKEMNTRFNP